MYYPGTHRHFTILINIVYRFICVLAIYLLLIIFLHKTRKNKPGDTTSLRAKINRRLIQFNMAWPCVVSTLPRG